MMRPRLLLLCACTLLAACDGGEQLPTDATLQITPAGRTISITEYRDAQDRCLFESDRFVDIPVLISLRNEAGSPLGGVSVSVYVDFADNTFGPFAPLALYEDRNRNGIVDADSELVSGESQEVARVRMDELDGTRALLLRVNLSCAYRSEVFAYVDGVSASAFVEVAAEEIDQPDPVDTDSVAGR